MTNSAKAWHVLEQSDLIATCEEVQTAIERVASEISERLRDAYPLVLAIMGGAVVFAGQLLPRLRFPLDFDHIHVSRYGSDTCGGGIRWQTAPSEAVRGRTVLVLDDILDGGETMTAVRDAILALGAAQVFCAVLADKRISRPKPISADFIGLRIPDRFVFGCGMDAMGFWRNLPEIRALRMNR